jgi:hypothetical protein
MGVYGDRRQPGSKEGNQVSSTEANFSVTFKTAKGNLVTVRGDSASDWTANMSAASTSGALGMIGDIEGSLSGRPAAPAPPKAAKPADPAPGGEQRLPDSFSSVPCKICQAPTRVERKVSPKDGNTYDIFNCTASQLHKPAFVKV